MEALAYYLLKSAIWLSGFTLVYFLFLQNERFFVLKRIYLISGILISLVFPLISVHYNVEIAAPPVQDYYSLPNEPVADSSAGIQQVSSTTPFYSYILLFLYLAGVLFLAVRLTLHITSLYKAIHKARIKIHGSAKLITTSDYSSSFSFFNYIFINPVLSQSEIEQVINHELVHVQQKHWFDLLIIELLRLIQWINPFAWLYSGFIRLNHEYMADEQALRITKDPTLYKVALLNQMFSSEVISLSNSFNYSCNKKRFDMMKTAITSPYRKLKLLIILPVFATILFSFAKPEYNYNYDTVIASDKLQEPEVKGSVMREDGQPLPGAIVLAMGTTLGTIVDAKGHFSLKGVPENNDLVISYVGYKTITVKPDFTSEMSIRMTMDTIELKNNRKSSPVFSKNPGDSGPLYVIDGKVVSKESYSSFDRSSIKTITVLKEKESVELYGGKNESSVILISTKNKESESPASVNASEGDQPVPAIPENAVSVQTDKNEPKTYDKPPVVTESVKPDNTGEKDPFVVVEELPRFPGGNDAMFDWLTQNLKYPAKARKKKIEGTVKVRFLIDQEGKPGEARIISSDNPAFDEEAKRLIGSMPAWKPGKQSGKAVSVYYMVPVEFKLTRQETSEKKVKSSAFSITRKDGLVSSDISKTKEDGNEVTIKYIEGGRVLISNYTLYNSSGRKVSLGNKIGFEKVNFPFELKINKTSSDNVSTANNNTPRLDINFECMINEPGTWEITLRAGAETFPVLHRDEEKWGVR